MSQRRIFTDQMGYSVHLEYPPQRIISLVPSQTELLYDLGLQDELVGITKFCIHPETVFRSKPRIGGTKTIHFDKIAELKPDLIIGNKEENREDQIKELMGDYPVWLSDIKELKQALQMIRMVGELTNRSVPAEKMIGAIEKGFQTILPLEKKIRMAYFIWKKPYMVAGKDTFINDMLERCGFENVFSHLDQRYPRVEEEEIRSANPQFILLSSEPFPFREKHFFEFQERCPGAKVMTVDGEMFSWFGSRLLQAPEYLRDLVNNQRGMDLK